MKSLADHQLRSYHTHKVWYGGVDKGLIECGKAQEWFTDYFDSELVTVWLGVIGDFQGCLRVGNQRQGNGGQQKSSIG